MTLFLNLSFPAFSVQYQGNDGTPGGYLSFFSTPFLFHDTLVGVFWT